MRDVLTSMLNALDKAEHPILSVKEFGAVGDGTADDTAAIQSALNQGAWKTIFFPAGLYRTTAALNVPNITNMRLLGEGRDNTTIRLYGNGTVLSLSNALFCSIEELTFQHGSGTGSGVVFTGNNGSNQVDRCTFSINAGGNGLAFIGTAIALQSGNRVTRCLFLENGFDQLYMRYSNDFVISYNGYGGGAGPTYSPAGCVLSYSSAGQYMNNEHWNNTNALLIDQSSYLRIANNRFEESRQVGVLVSNSTWCQFTGNYLHTNSQSSTGTYSALKFTVCSQWNITGNTFMSWNALRHKHSIESDAASSSINIVGNMMAGNTGTNINTSTAANVNSTGNM